jgi:ABC-type dipeptide/oligopeptide/nickel transport system permease component
MAFLMCGSIVVAMLNLVADLAIHVIDPRTREAV